MKHVWPSLRVLHKRAEEAARAYIPPSPQPTRCSYTCAVYAGKLGGLLVPVPWARGRVHNINHTGGSLVLYLADGRVWCRLDLPPGFRASSLPSPIESDKPLRWEFRPTPDRGDTFSVEFLLDNLIAQDADWQVALDAEDAR